MEFCQNWWAGTEEEEEKRGKEKEKWSWIVQEWEGRDRE
jgi:hypothetical protein